MPTTTEVGTDVLPKSAPPWHKELAVCQTHNFRLVYNRDIPAILVMRGDDVLAWAGLYRRDVSEECQETQRKPPPPTSEPTPEGVYESVDLRCNSPGEIRVDAHAIEMNGSVYGSQIYITMAGKPGWLVSAIAVEAVEGRRVYFNHGYCTRA